MPEYGVKKYIQDVKDGTIKPKEETRKKSATEKYAEKKKNNPLSVDVKPDNVIIPQKPQSRRDKEWKREENQSY